MSSIKEFQHLKISLQDLKSATNDFADSNCIGRGGFGKVYKGGILLSGVLTMVAIKRLDRKLGQGTTEFWKEIMMLSQYKHQNLVSLLGFCDEGGESLLVYEYLSKKSLDLYLISNPDLSWHNRLFICHGAAEGLKFLHEPTEGSQQRVLHRDIKSANILLDDNLQSKISDLGLSKLGPANQEFSFLFSNAVGTPGYCDPLYAHTGLLTKESDVYSFGIVLFEVLCGRPAYVQDYNDIRKFLAALARKCYEEKTLDTIIHSGIRETISPKSLERFSAIAYQCLHMDHAQRPSIAKIGEEILIAYYYQLLYESSLPEVPFKEIEVATEHFKTSIGSQSYIGELSIFGKPTAVIVFKWEHHSLADFLNWISFLHEKPHPNVMSIIGFCNEEKEKISIFEYPERGRLDQYINATSTTTLTWLQRLKIRTNTTSTTTLTWLQRLKICIGAAQGLYHIHTCNKNHGGFRSANVLLDDKWVAKVFVGIKTTNDHAYNAPEYIMNGIRTKEADVYSFGMVLMEVLCKDVDGCMLSGKLIKDLYEKKKLDKMVDPRLRKQKIGSYSVEKYSAIAYKCLLDDPKDRPSLDVVIKELQELMRIEGSTKISLPEVPLKEIEVATNNFEMCIGEHNHGQMYKAELSILGKPTTVLLKRYMHSGDYPLRHFWSQVVKLSGQPHRNAISILGYCMEEREKITVYEYPGRGRLDQYIRRSNNSSTTLTWLLRLKICAGAAHAVGHTHSINFVYTDIESSKILLDDKWVAKVTDFVISTPGSKGLDRGAAAFHAYGAPENINDHFGTREANVYSFGMVLFEVLCGRLCTEYMDGYMLSGKLIKELYEKEKLAEIVDPSLREQMISSNSLDKYSAIAYRCLLDDPKERPSMDVVVKELEELLRIEVELHNQFAERDGKLKERAKAVEEREKVAEEREKKMEANMKLIEEELVRQQTLRKEMEERVKEFNEMMIQHRKFPPPS